MMSISHRVTGVGLSLGMILLAFWVIFAAFGPSVYEDFHHFLSSWFGLIILFIFLTTYTPKFDFIIGSDFSIQKIEIEGNSILNSVEIVQKLNFLYRDHLFFLNLKSIEKNLKNETFIESFSLKKIYPNTLKIIIVEKRNMIKGELFL